MLAAATGIVGFLAFHAYTSPLARARRVYEEGAAAMREGRFADAAAKFAQAGTIAPDPAPFTLARIEAELRSGDLGRLPLLLQEAATVPPAGPHAAAVKDLLDRGGKAWQELEAAGALSRQGKETEALARVERAAALYPESAGVRAWALGLKAGIAFDAKDYETHLALNREAFALEPAGAHWAAGVAGGLACRYATTGDEAARREALDMLAQAERLAQSGGADDRAVVADAAERIRHRLETRRILTKAEYDRIVRDGKQ
jgi:tetratricopeptide (TPR) repeat protein